MVKILQQIRASLMQILAKFCACPIAGCARFRHRTRQQLDAEILQRQNVFAATPAEVLVRCASGEPRAQNLRALGPRTLRKPQNTVATLDRVGSALCMQKSPSDAPKSRKSSAKVARKNCKFPRILARRAQRSCLKSASVRCVN